MKHNASFFAGFVTALVVVSLVGTAAASYATVQRDLYYRDIRVTLDGKPLDLGAAEPFIIDGTTYLPMRAVAEALGLNVDWNWDGTTRTVVLTTPKVETAAERRAGALAALRNVADTFGAYKDEGGSAYNITADDGTSYTLLNLSAANRMEVVADHPYGGALWRVVLPLTETGDSYTVEYEFYLDENKLEAPTTSAKATIDAASFDSDSAFSFSSVSGSRVTLDQDKDLAKSQCLQALLFVNILLTTYDSGYTVADLGFTAYHNEFLTLKPE